MTESQIGRWYMVNRDDMAAKYWPGGQVPTGDEFDAAIDAALAAQGGKA